MEPPPEDREELVQLLINSQLRIRTYIRSLVPDANDADDILQETNLVIWRKAGTFTSGTNFGAWACKIAYFQVLAHRQRHARSRLHFDDELLGQIGVAAEEVAEETTPRLEALRHCMEEALSDTQRRMLKVRYGLGGSVQKIADEIGRPLGSIRQALYRVRARLGRCVEQRLLSGESDL